MRCTAARAPQSNDRHVPLPGEDAFSVWPWALVRGTGFSAGWPLSLGAPEAAHAVDRLLDARRSVAELQPVVLQRLLRASHEGVGGAQRRRAVRKVQQGAMPEPEPGDAPLPLDDWRFAVEQLAAAEAEAARVFETERTRTRHHLHRLAGDVRLREAIAWQNPPAARFMLGRLTAADDADDARLRRDETSLAMYVQRYCLKNDTIGFFGPVCWSRVSGEGAALVHHAGKELVASREVFYEDWAIVELCKVLDRNRALRPWLRPRRLPFVGLVGNDAYMLMPEPTPLGDLEARVLALCDGVRTARAIAAALREPEGEVFATLEGLCERGLAVWKVETIMSMRPQLLLRELLEGVEDEPLRRAALAPLDQLERARLAVAGAQGPDALLAALEALDHTFAELTGQAASRNAGQMYAARRLVFLDCRRADDITIGPAVLERLSPVLSILLLAARWFTSEVAREYRAALEAIYEEVAAALQTREVPLLQLWLAAESLFPLDGSRVPPPMEAVIARLRDKWQQVLPPRPPGATSCVTYSSDELLPRVREVFHARAPGWASARHHGPDILLAAKDAAAIARQDFQIVLGEFHCGANTSIASCPLTLHPRVEDLHRLWEADVPEPGILPGVPRESFPVRVNRELATEKDYRLEWSPEIAGPPRARPLPIGELVVVEDGGRVGVRSRDGALHFDLIEFLGQALSGIVPYYFQLPAGGGNAPRLLIDDVVVSRQKWTFTPADLAFWTGKTAAERFEQARAWTQERGIPRFCFVRSPVELKPIYIDFASPIYVDVLARLCRNAVTADRKHTMSISEMLPGPDELWLVDRQGNHYASEIRLVAVDRGEASA